MNGTRVLIALGLACASPALSQERIVIPDAASCRSCRIARTLVATLRDTGSTAAIGGWAPTVASDSRGRFYVADLDRSSVAVFTSAGKLLKRIGRTGSGPGEFRMVEKLLVGVGDTLWVFDTAHRRASVYSPSYDLVRDVPVQGQVMSIVEASPGRLVMNVVIPTDSRVGLSLHMMSGTGMLLQSFGSLDGEYRAGFEGARSRSLARHGPRQLYTARHQEYVVELWDLNSGRLVKLWERRTRWFAPWRSLPPLNEPPPTTIHDGLHRASDGMLWVLAQVADRNYETAVEKGGAHGSTVNDMNKWLDTMVEVIDPRAGRVVARQRFDNVMLSFLGDGLAFGSRDAEDGKPVLEIWRLSLVRPPSPSE